MNISDRHLGLAGLGLGLISLASTLSSPKADNNQALVDLARESVKAAQGVYVCVSWDCGPPEPRSPAVTPRVAQPVVYQEVEPGVQYVDDQGKALPLYESQGKYYLANYAP